MQFRIETHIAKILNSGNTLLAQYNNILAQYRSYGLTTHTWEDSALTPCMCCLVTSKLSRMLGDE